MINGTERKIGTVAPFIDLSYVSVASQTVSEK